MFHDPRWAALQAALDAGAAPAVTRADCRDEYRVVLHYPHLPLDAASRAVAEGAFDRSIAVLAPTARALRLPVCSDRDDQKFLEIARDGGAAILITKDKALLKLARKTQRDGLFLIQQPQVWLQHHLAAAAAGNEASA